MTREQAIYEFNKELNRPYPSTTTATHESTRLESAMIYAINALSEPVLDENGLARCGCGSKAEYMHSYPFCNGGLWGVYCADDKMLGCYVHSDMTADDRGSGANVGMCQTKEEARKNWNRAMGVKEAESE